MCGPRRTAWLAGVLVLCAGALGFGAPGARAAAQYPPGLSEQGKRGFDAYRLLGFNKAFAVAGDGRWFYLWSQSRKPADLVAALLGDCNKKTQTPCTVVSLNDHEVQGGDPLAIPTSEGPALAPLVPAPYYPIQGPQRASGILIWSHGVLPGDDNTRFPPQGWVNRFRDQGYDIYKFDRRWPDYNADLSRLRQAVGAARETGYRHVILAGQSVGAWMSLEAAARGAPVDGVLAAAPARFGDYLGSQSRQQNRDVLVPVIEALTQRDLNAVVMFFSGDPFDPGGRSERVRDVLAHAVRARTLLIDGAVGVSGHAGAASARFVTDYGECLRDFVLDGKREKPCGD